MNSKHSAAVSATSDATCASDLKNDQTSHHPARSLDQLRVGDRGLVGKITQLATSVMQFDPHLARRLMEIGFIPGEPLEVLHKGFFGGEPIAVRIGHSTFALRRFEAALISVVPALSVLAASSGSD